ncbi:MAG: 3-carboxy-cis,cis-muconate cycloisomerase [Desulfobacteraceae bacterium]
MSISPFDSKLLGPLFGDPDMAALFSDEAAIAAMLKVEVALAKVQAGSEVIPKLAYDQIAEVLSDFSPDPAALSRGTAESGVPVPELLKAARTAIGREGRDYLHWGVTSQDIVDTALVLRLREAVGLLEVRISRLLGTLASLAKAHAETLMVARTRWQQAVPTTMGHKLNLWAEPFRRHQVRLAQIQPRLLVLSLGGAAGTLAAMGDKGREVARQLAAELDLVLPATPWHSQRDGVAEFAGWLSMLTGSLGKIGQDLLLMAQSEVAEVRFSSGGGSSTMPQKSNPIGAEVLVTLSRMNAGLLGIIHQAQVQEHERGGAGWMLEWLTLPQMVMAAAGALKHTEKLFSTMAVDDRQMRANLEQSNGLPLAEAAVFALSAHMPKPDARKLVQRACLESRRTRTHVIDILSQWVDHPIDWQRLKDFNRYLGLV